ncbi:uncharacterized protein Bfra_006734 [Botrytis fragariae]|uniref:Uncharacterized protein n=1 Tax=Botrytis fragariae TaxID=1964551 RepID=A0A8H6EP49_9HELO|nr:uncharacterized protein Bfra_006734 [Botrytis fragariae]KAF5879526.1 hypothetical protein Bfra_006734 [Botrytis fragariae]
MPPKRKPSSSTPPISPPCTHTHLLTTSHPSAQFPRVSASRRAAATTDTGIHKSGITDTYLHDFASDIEFASTFPAPLVLKGDALEIDPKEPGQTFRGWERGKHRNAVPRVEEGGRRIIYVVGPPGVDGEEMEKFMKGWEECEVGRGGNSAGDKGVEKGKREMDSWMLDVISYLQAFYHGLPIKRMDSSLLQFTPWEEISQPSTSKSTSKSKHKPKSRATSQKNPPNYIGLRTSTFKTGIRYRPTPSSPFTHQLNLSDLLDLAIDILPPDAYALLMLVNHDLYEDDDDEFVCGRAYGGSRVAVVSTARYRPDLDAVQEIERIHAWPGSHCIEYMNEVYGIKKGKRKRGEDKNEDKDGEYATAKSPLVRAVTQQNTLPPLSLSPTASENALKGLFLSRICRTASHELGHCFGIAHCPYYACCMQGSASIQEDARQPPYLCPVDLKKVITATGADVRERYEALLRFCERHGSAHMFVAFEEWIRGRLEQIERVERSGMLESLE